jgi:hypothetical protein
MPRFICAVTGAAVSENRDYFTYAPAAAALAVLTPGPGGFRIAGRFPPSALSVR